MRNLHDKHGMFKRRYLTTKTNVEKQVDAYMFTSEKYMLDGEGGRAENGTYTPTVLDRLFDKLPRTSVNGWQGRG